MADVATSARRDVVSPPPPPSPLPLLPGRLGAGPRARRRPLRSRRLGAPAAWDEQGGSEEGRHWGDEDLVFPHEAIRVKYMSDLWKQS